MGTVALLQWQSGATTEVRVTGDNINLLGGSFQFQLDLSTVVFVTKVHRERYMPGTFERPSETVCLAVHSIRPLPIQGRLIEFILYIASSVPPQTKIAIPVHRTGLGTAMPLGKDGQRQNRALVQPGSHGDVGPYNPSISSCENRLLMVTYTFFLGRHQGDTAQRPVIPRLYTRTVSHGKAHSLHPRRHTHSRFRQVGQKRSK